MQEVYLNGTRIRLDPKMAIGKGGEADVYDIGSDRALKMFKPPDHPDYDGLPLEQEGARRRIAAHQRKLAAFPKGLPSRVITPSDLAMDRAGSVIGYTMPLIRDAEMLRRYTEKAFRIGVPQAVVAETFRDLHGTVTGTHATGTVIGDFNDLNVLVRHSLGDGGLVRGSEAYLIDADSMQFGQYPCSMFTARFVDPTHCDPKATSLTLVRPHDTGTDWYAYAVMLFTCLCLVDPYGGIYAPKDPKARMPHDARPLHRITVFHPDVRYPKPAIPFGVLPDDLLQYFHRTFERDERGAFPLALITQLCWTTCSVCGVEHARAICPQCATAAPAAVKSVTIVRGKVTATRIFRTSGVILHATTEGGELRWLAHEGDAFRRENGATVLVGAIDPHVRCRIHDSATLFGKHGVVVALDAGTAEPERRVVDSFGTQSVFDANGRHVYWIERGRLMRDGDLGPERIGDVLHGQTMVWVGDCMGFGFYRAGAMQVAFIFDAERHGVNDTLRLASIPGHLVDATAVFARDRCWFFVTYETGGKTMHRVTVIRSDGTVEATAEALEGDGSWLGTRIRGNAAAGTFLLVATDDGIVRVEPQAGTIAVTKTFPDTEPFADAGSQLHITKDGVAVVGKREIVVLKIV